MAKRELMILLGDGTGKKTKEFCKKHKIGRMLSCNWPDLYENEPWGFDNGAWTAFKKGQEFNENKFLHRLDRALKIGWEPYLAVLPDIVAGGNRSLELSISWIGNLPNWNWYLPVQDGMEVSKVIDQMPRISGIFLGGTTEYKKYAGYWSKITHHFGLKFHYARAGTVSKLSHAMTVNADSIDSTSPLWHPIDLVRFMKAMYQEPDRGLGLLDHVVFAPHPLYGEGSLIQIYPEVDQDD
jgi:hypothetical protein